MAYEPSQEQQALIEAFKAGGSLFIWRNSTPHNMWLSTENNSLSLTGKDYQMLKSLANHEILSNKRVSYSGFMFAKRDNGQPIMEGHFFNKPNQQQIDRVMRA